MRVLKNKPKGKLRKFNEFIMLSNQKFNMKFYYNETYKIIYANIDYKWFKISEKEFEEFEKDDESELYKKCMIHLGFIVTYKEPLL